ncbi:MAG: nitroreductase, partial [Gammaproteobacteria bacterium]
IAFDPEVLFEALKVKEDEIIYAITPLGYPRKGYKKGEKIRKSEKEVFRFI